MSNNNFKNETVFEFHGDFKVGYTVVPNYILNEKNISAKALGIYTKILQYQNAPNHIITVGGLVNFFKDGKESINTGLKELISFGYLKREKRQNEKGQFEGWKYTVYVKPTLDVEQNTTENRFPEVGFSEVGKSVNNNNNTNINKISNKENTNISSSSKKEKNEEEEKNANEDENNFLEKSNSIDSVKYIMKLCQNFNLKINKANIKNLLTSYGAEKIVNAINTIVNTSTYEKGEIKNYKAYLVKTLNDMNTIKVENKNITVNNTINNGSKNKSVTDYTQREDAVDNYAKAQQKQFKENKKLSSSKGLEALNRIKNS